MLDSIFPVSASGDTLTLSGVLAALGAALILGLIVSLAYIGTHKREGYSAGFTITLIMLPAIISIIIMLIGNNVARAFSLAGAFSLIRFRSAPGDPKDIAYVFFSLAVGLACGMGYLAYGTIFVIVLCLVMALLHNFKFGNPGNACMLLKITIPEDLNFQGLFDDILERYTTSWNMKRVKTTDFGTIFEIVYIINLKSVNEQKQFIDELRCRNGNLNISLTLKEYEDRVAV
ncbi:DUF4956 domain-containing protein [Ruminiclostridium cellobioparum]|jgi:hypothetical protein|uniref:DUF4956 domain-containing protein n=1 Tax=Ruminiclostridium cellobioparum subsp. termitidis CT1112 TaxID=1195236 RepID=S0FJ29_RUMCE|nr:DUF4956 domain-containing protein [Ruminiclostridium cellobioparum]EMS72085.1 hypothetical protein CTER_2112 [Ruminiclostridium cellobioparum subsp. termitidis CT1112]